MTLIGETDINTIGPWIVCGIALIGFVIVLPWLFRRRKAGEQYVTTSVIEDLALHNCRLIQMESHFTKGNVAKETAKALPTAILGGFIYAKNFNVFKVVFEDEHGRTFEAFAVAKSNSIMTDIITAPPELEWRPPLEKMLVEQNE